MMRLAGTFRVKMGSRVEESWWTSLRVGVPRSKVPGSVSSRITMQVPLMRGSSDSTAAVTKLANPMLVMKRPRFSTCSMGSCALRPLGDPHLAAEHAGFDADVGDGLGEAEGAAPGLAVFAGLGRGAAAPCNSRAVRGCRARGWGRGPGIRPGCRWRRRRPPRPVRRPPARGPGSWALR